MAQVLTQTQKLEQRQQLSAQQVLVAKLTELSVEELRARIETECVENPWLERKEQTSYDGDGTDVYAGSDYGSGDNYDSDDGGYNDSDDGSPDEERPDSNDSAQSEIDWDGNEFPTMGAPDDAHHQDDGDNMSFHELLMQQVGEYELNEHEQTILEYLIGSLDDDGMLRTPLYQIEDELDIYQGIRTNQQEMEKILAILQEFEPFGVGARNLCECLLIQAKHKEDLPMRKQLITMFSQYADEFVQKHWDVIKRKMKLSEGELSAMKRSITRLNPRPGNSVGSLPQESARTIVPDFRIQVDDNNEVMFQICETGIPALQMSDDPQEWMSEYDAMDEKTLSQDVAEAFRYQRNMIERGNMFIEALAQRRRSMNLVMHTIIKLQKPFFVEGDETLLRPMKLEDVATITNLDISTVSRVCRSKSVETPYGTYSLRWFFTSGTKKEGTEYSVRNILSAIKALVDAENKRKPLSDEALTAELKKQGYDTARRTVAKYREQLGIPTSRLRR